MKRTNLKWPALAVLVLLIVVAVWLLVFRHPARKAPAAPPGTPVSAVAAKLADVPVYIDSLGTVTPTRTVTVITQVNGILDSVDFKEGQFVRRGQVIARIDSRALEAQLVQAQGTLTHDKAALANAQLDLQRYRQLIKVGSITQQTLDTQVATVNEDQGTVVSDTGNVKNLQVQVSYCTIVSPVDGVVGLRLVDPGNYVTTTSTTGLAVITQLQPATIVYAVPEDYLGQIRRAMSRGAVAVLAYDRDKKTLLSHGTLLAVDNQVDTTTGTIKVKAEFPQSGDTLFPNQFVNARMQADTLNQIPVIPTAAIQHGTNGDFVFVVGAGNKVALRNVKSGPVSGDNTAILDGGVKAGERVVTDGADKLDNGSTVRVVAATPAGASGASGASGTSAASGASASPAASAAPASN
ncbi:efflux RND transporter periplasmic adaptor subunit [Paraburkholderia sp. D15]|uniref:efflux RND transporter periplasmic adaptor subunit n=1 Tax=Paraburkholderia sp. D15 TaxID=2880218 RepID=UPI00247951C5|nr:efflux RND transporter periplasmic adaptor subunit [Paraburkholderia sp. D15]WGS48083.1 efflux RND transporter periplasmic adaptor subunit [Paraburkholderia sp. D15]WKF55951.1 Multidrug resistance protein MdtA [Paraburkholderia busanensis]